jgi:uracil-DNA glycosylase family protein
MPRQSSGKAAKTSAADFLPPDPTLESLRQSAASCRGCDLYENATQTVFGEGTARADVMLVGEQPGDNEDVEGRPFVGPAGKVLDRGLEEAGIDRTKVYVTNAVKHFKWTPAPRGKRRIHKKPGAEEIRACRPWLEAEIDQVKPEVVVALGATAAQALMGRDFRLTQHRGELLESDIGPLVSATVHPSSILRAPDDRARAEAMEAFVRDLAAVATALR